MLAPGTVLYFTPFYFDDGTAKNKYFLVMGEIKPNKNDEYHIIIAALPSSQDHNPTDLDISHGCNDYPERGVNCYHFEKDVIITTNGFSFPLKTYIYGHWISDFKSSLLINDYNIDLNDYKIIRRLTSEEFEAVQNCIKASCNTKRKYKKWIEYIKY